jgi:predicted nucleic acid-binding protein
MILLDANILVRMADREDAKHAMTVQAVFRYRRGDTLVVVPQSIFEFAAVATRGPENNGLGMDAERAARWIARYRAMFRLVPDPPELCDLWQGLIAKHNVRGFRVHDARYVAAMHALGIERIMTHNAKHFADYAVGVIDPAAAPL